MSKKAPKVAAAAPPVVTGPPKWEQGLVQAQLQEDQWKVCIALLIENKLEDAVNVNFLNTAIATGSRRLFDKVTKQSLIREVYIYGNPKNRPKEIPQFAEVCEACKVHLDNKEEIPDILLAKLIKYKLLSIKADDVKRRQLSIKDADGGKNKAAAGAKAPKSAGKKGVTKKTPDPPSAKQGTLLKKRCEENLDQKFIDDEPDDGPQHYIIISGFYQTKLLLLLSELDVNINTIIRYGCSDYDRFLVMMPEKDESLPKDSRLIAAEEAAAAENIRIKTGSETFWKEIFPLLLNQPPGSPLNHTHIQDQWVQDPMPPLEKSDAQVTYCNHLFDDMAHLLYDLVDSRRQYENYINNMKIITVPDIGDAYKPSSSTITETPISILTEVPTVETQVPVDTRFYNDLMDQIPLESVTVPLIVHCLIEQIVATEDHIEPPSEKAAPPTFDGLHQEVATHLGEMIQKLSLDEESLSHVANMIPEKKIIEKDKLEMVNQQDIITKKFHHLLPFHGFDPEEVEIRFLKEYSPFGIYLFPNDSVSERQSLAARTQEFMHFCLKGGLPMAVANKLLSQNILECVILPNVDMDGNIELRVPTPLNAWDYPYGYLELKQLIKSENMQNGDSTDEDSMATPQESYDEISTYQAKDYGTDPNAYGAQINTTTSEEYSGSSKLSNEEEARITKVINEILSLKQRNLDNWNYVEHFSPNILQQVLREASYMLPYYEKYYNHHEDCLYLVFYNPHNAEYFNKETWNIQLHSNVGFRNYMLHVADKIQNWTQEEEKKYEAFLENLHAEMVRRQEMALAEAALAEQLAEKAPKDVKKPPNKKLQRSQSKSPTRQETTIFPTNGEFIRQGSLKAIKHEEELLRLEEEEKEKKKGQKSPKKAEKSVEKEQNLSPVMSQKSNRPTKSVKEESYIDVPSNVEITQEQELPFTGYNMGNNIISLAANKYTLFPNDGAQIRVETMEYLYGYQSVKCSVVKNGNVFNVHLLNPKDLQESPLTSNSKVDLLNSELNENPDAVLNQAEAEKRKKTTDNEQVSTEESGDKETGSSEPESDQFHEPIFSDFGSVSAVLSDGMALSFSKFGPTGYFLPKRVKKKMVVIESPKVESPKEETPQIPSPRETPSTNSGKKKKSKSSDSVETAKVSDEIKEPEPEVKETPEEPILPEPPAFQNLYLTCSDGLRIEYFLEASYGIEPLNPDQHRLLVKQSYPFRKQGIQPCESIRNNHAYLEYHRIVLSDGTVVKKMKDGTFEVFYVDGTVAKLEFVSQDKSTPDIYSVQSSCITGGKKPSGSEKLTSASTAPTDDNCLKLEKWTITQPSGQKFVITPDGKKVNLPRVLFSMKSDIKSGQTVLTRDDHVILLSETTGKTIVEHEDGTRITSYYEEVSSSSQRDSNTESSDEPSKKMFIMVECPSYATLKFNSKTSENLTLLGNGTLINVFPDGFYSLMLAGENSGDRIYLDLDGTLTYSSPFVDYLASNLEPSDITYNFRHNSMTICETVDPDGSIFKVNHKGQHTVEKNSSSNNFKQGNANEKKPNTNGNSRHAPRIFFLNPNGNGGEIHPSEKVESYISWVEQNPDCIILKDTFKDQPEISGITLLKPYKLFSETYLKDYELDCIIPESIRLQTAINPDQVKFDPIKSPDALEIRQFTQYPLVIEEGKNTLKQGMFNYIGFCFTRCQNQMDYEIVDSRSEDEQQIAGELLEISKKFLKEQLLPQLTINQAKELYEQGIISNQSYCPVVEQKQKESQNVPCVEKTKKDHLEEEMAKKALRNQVIPKYFESMFGKAFLETEGMRQIDSKLKKLSDFPVFKSDPPNYHNYNIYPKRGEYENSRELRPVNPSPTHAKGNASPNAVRPTNPTPNLQKTEPILDRPENPTSKELDFDLFCERSKTFSTESTNNPSSSVPLSISTTSNRETYKSIHIDIVGQPRSQPVPLPRSLVGGRPNAVPNQKFQIIEEPVRRHTRNILTVGSTSESQWRLKMMRGLNLYPESINFGVLKEGNSYMMSAYVINTGVDSCHFRIKQPPPATGLQITYKPGSVAAGLKRKIIIELFAIAVGAGKDAGVGMIGHNLEIITETNILYLPIQAITDFEYERQQIYLNSKSTPAELISTISLGTQGIIRPKRNESKAQIH